MERILTQTAESYELCDGRTHWRVTDDGAQQDLGACECEETQVTMSQWEDKKKT